MYEIWQNLNRRRRASLGNFGIFFLCWVLVYLPALPSFFYIIDDALSFYQVYKSDLTYTSPGSADLSLMVIEWDQQGRFLATPWDSLSNFLGIEVFLSNSQTWIGGIFAALTSVALLDILRVRYDLKDYRLLIICPCLYVITSPFFAEVQYLHSAAAIYALSTLLSIIAYRLIFSTSLGYRVLSCICNLVAFCLSQVPAMIFYCFLIIDFITEDLYDQKKQRLPLSRSWQSLGFYSSSLVLYAGIYLASQHWFHGSQARSLADSINFSFIQGKAELVWQIFNLFLTGGNFSPLLWTAYLEALLGVTVTLLIINKCRRSWSLGTALVKVLGLLLGLAFLIFASVLPLLIVPENWPSFRVCVTMSLSLVVLCVVTTRSFPPQSLYVKGLALTLVLYMFVQALNTLEQGTKRVLIAQRDEQTILRIANLNADHGVHQAQVVLGTITDFNPYHIPGRLSSSDILSSSTLEYDYCLDSYLRINGVGKVIYVSDAEQQQLNQTYCQGTLPMTPVWADQGLTILCR